MGNPPVWKPPGLASFKAKKPQKDPVVQELTGTESAIPNRESSDSESRNSNWKGEKTPTPKISALPRKPPVLLKANFVLTKDRE